MYKYISTTPRFSALIYPGQEKGLQSEYIAQIPVNKYVIKLHIFKSKSRD